LLELVTLLEVLDQQARVAGRRRGRHTAPPRGRRPGSDPHRRGGDHRLSGARSSDGSISPIGSPAATYRRVAEELRAVAAAQQTHSAALALLTRTPENLVRTSAAPRRPSSATVGAESLFCPGRESAAHQLVSLTSAWAPTRPPGRRCRSGRPATASEQQSTSARPGSHAPPGRAGAPPAGRRGQ
jgi:hypothetical protein